MQKLIEKILPFLTDIPRTQGFAVFVMFLGLGYAIWNNYQHDIGDTERLERLEQDVRDCYNQNREALLDVVRQNTEIMRDNSIIMGQVKSMLESKNQKSNAD